MKNKIDTTFLELVFPKVSIHNGYQGGYLVSKHMQFTSKMKWNKTNTTQNVRVKYLLVMPTVIFYRNWGEAYLEVHHLKKW